MSSFHLPSSESNPLSCDNITEEHTAFCDETTPLYLNGIIMRHPYALVDLRSAEQATYLFGVLLAILGGNNNLVLFGRLYLEPIWLALNEDLSGRQTSARISNCGEIWIVRRVFKFALGS